MLQNFSNVNDVVNHLALLLQKHESSKVKSRDYYAQQARWLLQHVVQKSFLELISHDTFSMSEAQYKQLHEALHLYIHEHKPLAYLIGTIPFLDLMLEIKEPILIPRPETEAWVQELIDTYRNAHVIPSKILDMCTGSGAIGLALARAFKSAHVTGSDINPQALAVAHLNKNSNNINNISFVQSDLYEEFIPGPGFDLIVANPPYIDPQEWLNLDASVRDWEDFYALVAPNKGLGILETIIKQAAYYLTDGVAQSAGVPNIVVEMGYDQANSVVELMYDAQATTIVVHKDSAGHDRWVSACMPSRSS